MSLTSRFHDVLVECDVNRNYSPIFEFLRRESRRIFFAKDKEELVSLVPEILRHTNKSNLNWLNIEVIKEYPGFYDALKEGIYSSDPYENGLMYSAILSRINYKDFYDEELVTFLASRELHPKDVCLIIKDICMEKPEMATLFLQKLKIELTPELSMEIVQAINAGCNYYSETDCDPVAENIDMFIETCGNLYKLYECVKDEEAKAKVKDSIQENIDDVLTKVSPYQILTVIRLCDNEEARKKAIQYAADHFDEIVSSYPSEYIFDVFIKDIEGIPVLEQMRDEYVNNNFDKLVESMYFSLNNISKEDARRLESNPDREAIIDIIKMVFEEVCKNEDVNFSDIKRIGRGGFTDVYQVGEKVIKIGHGRGNKVFPNNPYIIAPLMRKEFAFKNGKRYEGAFVEVTERVDILDDKDVSEEELYALYSRMREIGLEWMDIEARNVGLLRRDNSIYWNEVLEPSDEALGLAPRVGAGVHLKKGDLVILDADFIYEEGSVPKALTEASEDEEYGFIRIWRKFNERYNEEHYGSRQTGGRKFT